MTTTPEQTESAENARFEPVQGGVVIWDSISHMMKETAEQAARDMLERMGIEDAQSFTSGDLMEWANLIAASKKATPAPAWEPLTPERLEALRGEDGYPEYWLAIEGRSAPEVGRLNCGEFVVYEPGNEHETWVKPSRVTHIIPFITPEMPKA